MQLTYPELVAPSNLARIELLIRVHRERIFAVKPVGVEQSLLTHQAVTNHELECGDVVIRYLENDEFVQFSSLCASVFDSDLYNLPPSSIILINHQPSTAQHSFMSFRVKIVDRIGAFGVHPFLGKMSVFSLNVAALVTGAEG
jgi:hypothetical protein